LFFFVLLLAGIRLWSVHYDYTGAVSQVGQAEPQIVEGLRYPYPYYSDEWYSVALIEDAIRSHALPLRNPLAKNLAPLANLEAPFHSLLAELTLLLGLDPLRQFTLLTIGFGLLLFSLLYCLLRQLKVSVFPAAITALLALSITNGANLPGWWTLIPIIIGTLFLLLTFSFLIEGNIKMALLAIFLTLLFYPPLVIFLTIAIISFLATSQSVSPKEKQKLVLYFLLLVLLAAMAVASFAWWSTIAKGASLDTFMRHIFSAIVYQTYTAGTIPHYSPFAIISLPLLFFAACGMMPAIRKKQWWLLGSIAIGFVFWAVYSQALMRFVIEYQRIVFVTALLVAVLAGIGMNACIEFLKQKISSGR